MEKQELFDRVVGWCVARGFSISIDRSVETDFKFSSSSNQRCTPSVTPLTTNKETWWVSTDLDKKTVKQNLERYLSSFSFEGDCFDRGIIILNSKIATFQDFEIFSEKCKLGFCLVYTDNIKEINIDQQIRFAKELGFDRKLSDSFDSVYCKDKRIRNFIRPQNTPMAGADFLYLSRLVVFLFSKSPEKNLPKKKEQQLTRDSRK
jgi:hypothetical protein